MNLNISGQHVEVTPALREYVITKLKKLERRFDHLIRAEVVLSVEKQRQTAECTIRASGMNLHAEATDTDLYAAIDMLSDKLELQTRRYKEKLRDHRPLEAHKRMAV
ncbi:ribosome-associated translation inhibitor RaiA [Sinimarinibacterium sp. NLF-5-8]|uniref:ribosome hibernation-promoting factor, HPF/YfiA family n=1 Tax=Sinimarinibacterium sp. NLF-5-8 TaxID=2698684 RepID=UPI00137C285C|nr:ribosome-associated translation inhibitor RaiA [Sinimarinibacterium sp. NLF-5-8]QHS10053.1 ribosome-associated translation inhibitor RaiA [Sinimarinibacterium sp. NLF-5-8]